MNEWLTVKGEIKQTADPKALSWDGNHSYILIASLPPVSAISSERSPQTKSPCVGFSPQLGLLRCPGAQALLRES